MLYIFPQTYKSIAWRSALPWIRIKTRFLIDWKVWWPHGIRTERSGQFREYTDESVKIKIKKLLASFSKDLRYQTSCLKEHANFSITPGEKRARFEKPEQRTVSWSGIHELHLAYPCSTPHTPALYMCFLPSNNNWFSSSFHRCCLYTHPRLPSLVYQACWDFMCQHVCVDTRPSLVVPPSHGKVWRADGFVPVPFRWRFLCNSH